MSVKKRGVFSREFKLGVIARMEAGERVGDISRELGVSGTRFYQWMKLYRVGGAENLRLARRSGASHEACPAVGPPRLAVFRRVAAVEAGWHGSPGDHEWQPRRPAASVHRDG